MGVPKHMDCLLLWLLLKRFQKMTLLEKDIDLLLCLKQGWTKLSKMQVWKMPLKYMPIRGILFQGVFVPCYSHSDDDINQMVKAFRGSLVVYKKALAEGVEKYLVGDACKAVFRKWN